MISKRVKIAIVIAIVVMAGGYFILVNKIISAQAPQTKTSVAKPSTQQSFTATDIPPLPSPEPKKMRKKTIYPDSPRKTLCQEFSVKAAPDILLKGPEAIDKLNENGFRCRALFPAAMPLTKEQLEEAREETFTSCMENKSKDMEQEIRNLLAKLPSDCKE